jgi:hypothetical protein
MPARDGADGREVPAVKRGGLGRPKTSGDGRHGGIGDARRKIKISFRDFGHAADVGALESGNLEPVTAGRPEEGHLSLRSRPRLEELPDLPQDRRGHPARRAVATYLSPTGWHGCRFPLVRRHKTRSGAGKPVTELRYSSPPTCGQSPGTAPLPSPCASPTDGRVLSRRRADPCGCWFSGRA